MCSSDETGTSPPLLSMVWDAHAGLNDKGGRDWRDWNPAAPFLLDRMFVHDEFLPMDCYPGLAQGLWAQALLIW